MEGPSGCQFIDAMSNQAGSEAGILPRIAVFISGEVRRYQKSFQKEMVIEVSALEIYCENIRDLLWEKDPYLDPKLEKILEIHGTGE